VTRWFTADLHLGHANIIRYCDRPFASVGAMDRALVERWNEVVADGAEVWVLGDVAMGQIDRSLGLVHELAGTKLLVPGNHDRCWSGRGESARVWEERYLRAGFEAILPERLDVELACGPSVQACHFPYSGDSQDEERYTGHRPVDDGRVVLHGHVHTKWRVDGRQLNVGCDVWDYTPVADGTLASLITDPPGD
jgi:calcineurin-like phosphoesterase family protein